jgi:hypothetical protein
MLHPWRCRLIYQMFAKLLSWMVLHARSDTAKEIEILVLRHPHPRACGVPEVGRGSLTNGDRWSDMIPACRYGCCT